MATKTAVAFSTTEVEILGRTAYATVNADGQPVAITFGKAKAARQLAFRLNPPVKVEVEATS